jgi:hypothetical protein
VDTLDEVKARITATIADVESNKLQRVWQEMNYKWDA